MFFNNCYVTFYDVYIFLCWHWSQAAIVVRNSCQCWHRCFFWERLRVNPSHQYELQHISQETARNFNSQNHISQYIFFLCSLAFSASTAVATNTNTDKVLLSNICSKYILLINGCFDCWRATTWTNEMHQLLFSFCLCGSCYPDAECSACSQYQSCSYLWINVCTWYKQFVFIRWTLWIEYSNFGYVTMTAVYCFKLQHGVIQFNS